jgi:hypothetical protein
LLRVERNQQPVPVKMTSDIQGVGTSPAITATSTAATPVADHPFSFHDLLSAMNPLQYLPVVGTIYRAITGDVIPEGLRRAGSMLVSGLMGGPIGLVINIAATIVEKATGIDPEKIVAAQLNPQPTTASLQADSPADPPAQTVATPVGLTPSQLTAYGVRSDSAGTLKLGTIQGADVLNAIQLAELGRTAAVAYAANQPPMPKPGVQLVAAHSG